MTMTTPARLACLVAVVLHAGLIALVRADDPQDVFARANDLFDQAEQRMGTDPHGARELFGQAAALYASLVAGGIDNPDLHANEGTALLLSGDVGHAIASYLRADRIDPTNEAVRSGLAAARKQVETQVHHGASRRLEDVLLFWRVFVPRIVVVGVGIAAWWVCCGVATLAVVRRSVHAWWLAASAIVVAFCVASLIVEQRVYVGSVRAVTIRESDARLGPGINAYAEAFGGPLSEGVEVEVLERRESWTRVRLADGRTAWVMADSLETV